MPRGKGRIPNDTLALYANSGCMTVQELADGLTVHRSYAYRLVNDGIISHIRIGGRIAIPRAAFIAYKQSLMTIGSVA